VERLKTAWINEQCSPEILQYEADIISTLLSQIEHQQQYIDEEQSDPDLQFHTHLYEIESERVKYMMRCYLRERLFKIEKHVIFILKNEEMTQRLSPEELTYAQKYCDLLEESFGSAFLNLLPENLRSLTEQTSDLDMIPKPNLDSHVFCKVIHRVGDYQLDEEDTLLLEQDDIYLLRYRPIRPLLQSGKIQLI